MTIGRSVLCLVTLGAMVLGCGEEQYVNRSRAIQLAKEYAVSPEVIGATGVTIDTSISPEVRPHESHGYSVVIADSAQNVQFWVSVHTDGLCELSLDRIDGDAPSALDRMDETAAIDAARDYLDSPEIRLQLEFSVDDSFSSSAQRYDEGRWHVLFLDNVRNVSVEVMVTYGKAGQLSYGKIDAGSASILDSVRGGPNR